MMCILESLVSEAPEIRTDEATELQWSMSYITKRIGHGLTGFKSACKTCKHIFFGFDCCIARRYTSVCVEFCNLNAAVANVTITSTEGINRNVRANVQRQSQISVDQLKYQIFLLKILLLHWPQTHQQHMQSTECNLAKVTSNRLSRLI